MGFRVVVLGVADLFFPFPFVAATFEDGDFSAEESRSAKGELDQRNRASLLATLDGSQSGGNSSLALLKQIGGMSDEEKSVMGYTDAFVDRIAQNYRTLTSLQGTLGSNSAMGLLSQF